jgi:hypothetical protein
MKLVASHGDSEHEKQDYVTEVLEVEVEENHVI